MVLDDTEIKWFVILMLLVGGGIAAWYFWDDIFSRPGEPVVVEPDPVAPEPETREPLHPIEPITLTPGEGELVELPPLDESDSYFALALIDLFGPELEALLNDEGLIDKTVASTDNLTRSRVSEKIRPVGRLSENFVASAAGSNGPFYLSPDNYARYDGLVNMLSGADVDAIVETYRRFYPLAQEAYTRLGYPDSYFNDRAIAVIDHLLATPEPEQPVRLVRPHVLYEYADPGLEALSGGQKLLLRMGPDHAARVKAVLSEIRTRIANAG